MTKRTRVWRIKGFDGLTEIFRIEVPLHFFSERQVEEILKRLVCRHLTGPEIVDASRNQKDSLAPLLEVRRSHKTPLNITVGDNPYYVASIEICGEVS